MTRDKAIILLKIFGLSAVAVALITLLTHGRVTWLDATVQVAAAVIGVRLGLMLRRRRHQARHGRAI